MKLQIKVTEEDIKNGIPTYKCLCPVALAVKRAIGTTDPQKVWVGLGKVEIFDDYKLSQYYRKTFILPNTVNQFVTRFDNGYEVQPFEFELESL